MSPFLLPLYVIDVDQGHIVEVECLRCGEADVAVHDAAGLGAIEHAADRGVAMLLEALEALAIEQEFDQADRFARALRAGLILPEDF